MQLINYQHSTFLHPGHPGWLDKLAGMLERLYVQETRRAIRLVMLSVLGEVVTSNLLLWEDSLMERAVLPFLAGVETEADPVVRVQAVQLLATFATRSSGSHLGDLVDILEKIVKKFVEAPPSAGAGDTAVVFSPQDHALQLEAVRGLLQCMKAKLYLGPGAVAKRCFSSLVWMLDHLYDRPALLDTTGQIRHEVFRLLLTMRANR